MPKMLYKQRQYLGQLQFTPMKGPKMYGLFYCKKKNRISHLLVKDNLDVALGE